MPLRLAPLLAVLALALAASLSAAPQPAYAMCVSTVVVDGKALHGQQIDRSLLPRRGPERQVVVPACNDAGQDEPDRTGRARTLRGIPAAVAVVRGGSVYVDDDSLTVLGDHPLHRAIAAEDGPVSYRERHPCRREKRAQQGTVTKNAGTRLELRRPDRTAPVPVSVDAATRIAGRPAYQPIREGQRVTLRTSLCGPRRVADSILLTGPVPAAATHDPSGRGARRLETGTTSPAPWIAAGAGIALLPLAGFAVARRRRRTTGS